MTYVTSESFAEKLKGWKPELRHKERAALLGVELDTFRGWLYGRHTPSLFVQKAIEEKMVTDEP